MTASPAAPARHSASVADASPSSPSPTSTAPSDPEDVRVVAAGEPVVALDLVGDLVGRASAAVEALGDIEPADLDERSLSALAAGLERLRRQVEATAVTVVDRVDVDTPFRDEGIFAARSWSTHRLGLSRAEALGRVQTARFHRRVPLWANAAATGLVGVAQGRLMARLAANPRISDEALAADRYELLTDAIDLPFAEFERRARRWAALADPVGAAASAADVHGARDLRIRPRADGGWCLWGRLDDAAGAEVVEVFAHFVDAEWRADWDEARSRLGDAAAVGDLRRTQAQRQADALASMARAAASGGGRTRALPTVNILIDAATFEATVRGGSIEPARYRGVACRTQSGRELHPADAVGVALWGHVRRVVYDAAGAVIDLGRRRRLFTGAAREAALLLATECVWVGCDRPVTWCQADHSVGWAAHGATVPRNGQPLCGRHNRFKERGYRVRRDRDGNWHTHRPDGREVP